MLLGFLKLPLGLAAVLALTALALRVAFPLPRQVSRPDSAALPISRDTRLGGPILAAMTDHPGQSGIRPLGDGREALAARVLLVRSASATIDAQYYIWHGDATGWILLDELRAAAERGVRVRLLLDDNGIPGLDRILAALDALPTLEVRLYNPFTLRRPKLGSYLFDFRRLNRRMHNKAMVVDGAAAIVGGRNIGDIYFDHGDGAQYLDFDVLAVGQAAADVAANFDDYWSADPSYPASAFLSPAPEALTDLERNAAAARESGAQSGTMAAISDSRLLQTLADPQAMAAQFTWTRARLLTDPPDLTEGIGAALDTAAGPLVDQLTRTIAGTKSRLDLVSPYFIPGRQGTAILTRLARSGATIRILTNSLDSTDVAAVHSAYVHYRKRLLRSGVELLELRSLATSGSSRRGRRRRRGLAFSSSRRPRRGRILTGSRASLHAKTFAIDGRTVFVGSFNFDPRSARLNTEMGLLFDDPQLAAGLARTLDDETMVYRLALQEGALRWHEVHGDGDTKTYTADPHTGILRRGIVRLLGWLPVEWML